VQIRARVIVVNWNGRRWLGDCLRSVEAQGEPGVEIVLVDNASTDGSVDDVRRDFPNVRVIALDRNEGFARANNLGAKDATADYLVFLNNDTRARPGWLRALFAGVESDPAVGLVASRLVYMNRPDLIDSAGDGYLRCGGAFKVWHGRPTATAPGERDVFGVCGAAFLIRRSLFDMLGGFDEKLFMIYEDVDLSFRARLSGARALYAPDATVDHVGSASVGRVSDTAVFYGQRNLEWVWFVNMPRALLWRSLAAHVLYDLTALAGYTRQGRLRPWLRAKVAAMSGMRAAIAARRRVQRTVRVDTAALWELMEPNWTAIKRQEKQFDFDPASAHE
jgi:GT2 family glycosyltransferase